MSDLETICQKSTTGERETYITFNNTDWAWIRLPISEKNTEPGERETMGERAFCCFRTYFEN